MDGSSHPPEQTNHQSPGVAALHTSRKMRDSRPCQLPGKKDAFGTAETTLWQRQGSHSSSSARENEIKHHV